jgi:hypothetical protein
MHEALDRLVATIETLEGLYARAKDDGDAAALVGQIRARRSSGRP